MEKLSMLLIVGGLLLIIGYVAYIVLGQVLAGAPLTIRLGILMILSGLIVALIKLLMERMKGGGNEDVNRKY